MSNPIAKEEPPQQQQPLASDQPPELTNPVEPQQQSQPTATAAAAPARAKKPERPLKVYDVLLDAWYYNEVNKRDNQDAEIFKNYQINPYTKKTLDYVTPKITERRKQLPKEPCCCSCCRENQTALSETDQRILDSYKLVKRAMDRSVNPPKLRFCEPQTEAMRLGWFPPTPKPPTNLQCMYIKTCWSDSPCCYMVPKDEAELTQNEQYDERFRAVHRTAEFIRTETKLRHFDSIMNPDGFRGKIKTERKRPSGLLGGVPPPPSSLKK